MPPLIVAATIGNVGLCASDAHCVLCARLIDTCACAIAVTVVVYPTIRAVFFLDALLSFAAIYWLLADDFAVVIFDVFFTNLIAKAAKHQVGVIKILTHST